MSKRKITLADRKQVRTLSNPVRQDIVRILRLSASPMTPKALADRLLLSPVAVQNHLDKLEELGLVEVDHREKRGTMTVTYYRDADAELHLSLGQNGTLRVEGEALAANLVDGVFRSLLAATGRHSEEDFAQYGMLLSGVLHLRPEEREELTGLIRDYLTTHDQVTAETTEHWEYVLMAYRPE